MGPQDGNLELLAEADVQMMLLPAAYVRARGFVQWQAACQVVCLHKAMRTWQCRSIAENISLQTILSLEHQI